MNLNLIIKKGHEGLKHLPYLIGFIVLVIITLGTFYRLQFGVDFRDEAYYLALAHSLNIGNIPFVSEYSLHQTSSWLTYPIVTILSYIIGTDGLVLAMRTLYLIFSLISGLFIGSIITGKKFSFLGCFIGSLLWLYWPFAIPNFSYNTLCSILFTLSIFSFLYSLELTKEKKNKFIILSALLISLSIISYPPMLAAGVFYLLCILIYFRKLSFKDWNEKTIFISTLAGLGLFCFLLFTYIGWGNILGAFKHVSSFGIQGGSSGKLSLIFSQFKSEFILHSKTQKYILLIGVILFFFRNLRGFSPLLLIIGICWSQISIGPLFLPSYLAILPPLFIFILRDSIKWKPLLFLVWIPSIAAAFVTSYTSGNGFPNAMLGAMPAALLTMYLSSIIVEKHIRFIFLRRLVTSAAFVVVMLTCARFLHISVYGDRDIAKLNIKISKGPYAGLRCEEMKFAFMNEFYEDMQNIKNSNAKSILFYDDFPAGYLYSNLKFVGPSIWLFSDYQKNSNIRSQYIKYYENENHTPDVVIEFKSSVWNFYESTEKNKPDIMTNYFKTRGFKLIRENSYYWIWKKPSLT